MNHNTRIVVDASAPFHAGREGFFQFMGEGPSAGIAVLSTREFDDQLMEGQELLLFAVKLQYVNEL